MVNLPPDHNPFQAPQGIAVDRGPILEPEIAIANRTARLSWYLAVLILGLPALNNLLLLSIHFPTLSGIPIVNQASLATLFISSIVAFGLISVRGFDWLTRIVWKRSSQASQQSDWIQVTYQGLRRSAWLAAFGAFTWKAWMYLFFEKGYDSFLLSFLFALLGHIIAACFYLPIIAGWYRLDREARAQNAMFQ